MKISVVSVGTELLKDKINTNLLYISKKIFSLGLKVLFSSTVADDIKTLSEVLSYHLNVSDIIITTGGLGPTIDDVTKECVSKLLNKKLVFCREIYENIVRYFIEKNQEVPNLAEKQAYVIDGAEILVNKIGHAPGQKIVVKKDNKEKILYLLPGPPRELQPMFDEYVLKDLKKFQTRVYKEKIFHICNIPESKIEEIIKPVLEIEQKYSSETEFSILPHLNIVDVKVAIYGHDELKVDEELTLIKDHIYECFKNAGLSNAIYGEDNQTLEQVIGLLLAKHRKTLAVAESCTGGLLANRITNVAGSSFYFLGGCVTYSNFLKEKILNVKKETLETYGAVSEQTVKEMCIGLKTLVGADYCISISGIAGPTGGTKEKPVGTVWICVYDGKEFFTQCFRFLGGRLEVKEQAVNSALEMLRQKLIKDLR